MSFLFTFRLPNLPFLNPFATRTVEEEPSESIGQPSWDIHSNSRISKRGLYSQPMQQQQPDLINEEAGSIINSRKRSREEIEYDSSLPNMYQGRMRRLGRVEYDGTSRSPVNSLEPTNHCTMCNLRSSILVITPLPNGNLLPSPSSTLLQRIPRFEKTQPFTDITSVILAFHHGNNRRSTRQLFTAIREETEARGDSRNDPIDCTLRRRRLHRSRLYRL